MAYVTKAIRGGGGIQEPILEAGRATTVPVAHGDAAEPVAPAIVLLAGSLLAAGLTRSSRLIPGSVH
jgi:hypothetical protein